MAGDDAVLIIDQNRIGKAKALNAIGDLADLLSRVGPGIRLIRQQLLDRYKYDVAVYVIESPAPCALPDAELVSISANCFITKACIFCPFRKAGTIPTF